MNDQMHIFLIRHGESVLNAGENYIKRIPDHLVPMTEEGHAQARKAGAWLTEYCREQGIDLSRARIWTSPHLRSRQTAEEFNRSLLISDVREDITLVEQQYGLFDSVEKSRLRGIQERSSEYFNGSDSGYGAHFKFNNV